LKFDAEYWLEFDSPIPLPEDAVEVLSLKDRFRELLDKSNKKGYFWYYVIEQNRSRDLELLEKT
jgi:hypothetical protein